jgi:7tm Chemosensory receptor
MPFVTSLFEKCCILVKLFGLHPIVHDPVTNNYQICIKSLCLSIGLSALWFGATSSYLLSSRALMINSDIAQNTMIQTFSDALHIQLSIAIMGAIIVSTFLRLRQFLEVLNRFGRTEGKIRQIAKNESFKRKQQKLYLRFVAMVACPVMIMLFAFVKTIIYHLLIAGSPPTLVSYVVWFSTQIYLPMTTFQLLLYLFRCRLLFEEVCLILSSLN